jgi:methylglyoxal synthase
MSKNLRQVGKIKNIALVAHDAQKESLLEWAKYNKSSLEKHALWATGTTGKLLEKRLGLKINKLKSGPMGGDQQLGAMIASGNLDCIFFWLDPLDVHPHSSDISALARIAAVYNVVIACNRSTADFIISSPLFTKDYNIQLTDYSAYVNRFDK